MQSSNSIIIFDSGVGGLSIYQEIKNILPAKKLIYYADTLNFPYGNKSNQQITDRTLQCLLQITKYQQPELIVIACNTASINALETIRKYFNIPIVGVVPAIKTAAKNTKKRCIGLLATPNTISHHYTKNLIKNFANHCEVITVGSIELVETVESFLKGQPLSYSVLSKTLYAFTKQINIPDYIVLGCTHFPLIKNDIKKNMKHSVKIIDSGKAIAIRVQHLLSKNINSHNYQGSHDFIYTNPELTNKIKLLTPILNQYGFNKILSINSFNQQLQA